MAENGNQHCPFCRYAIIADAMGVTLKSHLDITVAQQSLYRGSSDRDLSFIETNPEGSLPVIHPQSLTKLPTNMN
jgi:hypothetical protein